MESWFTLTSVCLQCRHCNFLPFHLAPWELHFGCSFCYSHFCHRQPHTHYSFNSALQDPLRLCFWPNSKAEFQVSIAFWSLDVTIDFKSSTYSIQSHLLPHHWLTSPGFPSLQLYGPGKTNDPLVLRVLICPLGMGVVPCPPCLGHWGRYYIYYTEPLWPLPIALWGRSVPIYSTKYITVLIHPAFIHL